MKRLLKFAGFALLGLIVVVYNMAIESYSAPSNTDVIAEPTQEITPTEEIADYPATESTTYTVPAKESIRFATPILKQKSTIQSPTPTTARQQTSEKYIPTQYNTQSNNYPTTNTEVNDQYSKKQTCNDNAWSTKSACDWDCSNYPLTVESCKQQCNENFRLSKLSCDSL